MERQASQENEEKIERGKLTEFVYRSFLNTDPPLLVDVWRRQPTLRGQVSTISCATLEQHVFSKPYFDSEGLILAIEERDGESFPVGFVHAGFSPNKELSNIDTSIGVISQVKVVPGERAGEIAADLLQRGCDYLKSRGALRVHAGTHFPYSPFYLGLYGGSQVPGILDEDVVAIEAFKRLGFSVDDKIVIHERRLAGFRTITDREQIGLRRQYQIHAVADPLEKSWWESCTLGTAERDRFSVCHKTTQEFCGSVSFWDIQPLAGNWGVVSRGMYELNVAKGLRRSGIATFLVGEAIRHLMQQGIGLVEAQTQESDLAAIGVFRKLGFEQVSCGLLMSKSF